MSDCTNIDIRELLPEFLHGKLGADARASVERHLSRCAECQAELELIAAARSMIKSGTGQAVDVASIVAALPRPSSVLRRQRRSIAPGVWRVAATLALVAGGAAAVVLAVPSRTSAPMVTLRDSVMVTPPAVVGDSAVGRPDSTPPAAARPVPELASTTPPAVVTVAAVSDLGDEELEALIDLLDRLEAAPHADPDLLPARRVLGETAGTTR